MDLLDKVASSFSAPQPLSQAEIDAKLAAFDSIPLFMKSLPTEDTDDAALAALQELAHEGTPDEVAQNFKEQGNEYFKEKRYREALGFYTQGVDSKPTDTALQEALLCNRAACNLELKNFGSVLKDCSKALIINPQSAKAYFRSASALLALDRVEEALDCCNRCLAFDEENKSIQLLREKAIKAKEAKDKVERDKHKRLRTEQEAKRVLHVAFRERNLITLPKTGGSSNPYTPHWDPDSPPHAELIFPVFFLYPQYATSDVISHFLESTPFSAHISTMFPPNVSPPEWDVDGVYTEANLVVYAMTHRKRLLKVGKKMSLRDVMRHAGAKEGQPKDGLEVKDGCLTFAVLPRGEVEVKWVEEYKKARDE